MAATHNASAVTRAAPSNGHSGMAHIQHSMIAGRNVSDRGTPTGRGLPHPTPLGPVPQMSRLRFLNRTPLVEAPGIMRRADPGLRSNTSPEVRRDRLPIIPRLPGASEQSRASPIRESDDPKLFLHASPKPLVEAATASPLGFRLDAHSGHATLTRRILGWGESTGRDVAPDSPHRDVEPFGVVELAHPFRIRRRDDAPSHRRGIALVLPLHRPTVHALPISIEPPHPTSLPGRDPFRAPEVPLQGTRHRNTIMTTEGDRTATQNGPTRTPHNPA